MFVFLVAQQKAVVAAQLKSVAEQKIRIERWERKMVEGRLYLFVVPGFMLPRSMWLCNCAVTVRDWSKVVLMAWNSSWILVEVVVFCGWLNVQSIFSFLPKHVPIKSIPIVFPKGILLQLLHIL